MVVVKSLTHMDMTFIMRLKQNMVGVIKDFITLYLKKAFPVFFLASTEIEKHLKRKKTIAFMYLRLN